MSSLKLLHDLLLFSFSMLAGAYLVYAMIMVKPLACERGGKKQVVSIHNAHDRGMSLRRGLAVIVASFLCWGRETVGLLL